MKHKAGDTRADGYVFAQYSRSKNGKVYELWLSPDARQRDLERRRKRLEMRRKSQEFLQAERAKKNELRKKRYATEEAYRKKAIESAVEGERKRSKNPDWRAARNARKRARCRNRYATDGQYASVLCNRSASGRVKDPNCPGRLPTWARQVLLVMYATRKRVSDCTGILHHVDHIVPIAHGGKHTPVNLRVIPAKLNLRKHAKALL